MEKKGFFKKIDELYTKVTHIMIGDSPRTNKEGAERTKKTTSIMPQDFIGTFKEKILTLGTPKDNSLLYKEVIKREREEAKEAKRVEREEAKRKRETAKKAKETTKAQKEASKKTTKKKPSTKISTKKETKPKTKKTTTKKTTSSTTKAKTTTAKSNKTKSTVKKTTGASKTTANKTSTKKTTTNTKSTSAPKVATKTKAKTEKSTPKSTIKKTTATKTKSSTATKSSSTKTVSKTKAIPKGSKRDEKIALYIKDIKKHYGEVDEDFVAVIVKNLGPSIYKKDAESVACSDPKELATVRKNFLMKKLGIDASQEILDAAIQDVCTELKGVRTKYRATFYYTLAKKFKKESVLS